MPQICSSWLPVGAALRNATVSERRAVCSLRTQASSLELELEPQASSLKLEPRQASFTQALRACALTQLVRRLGDSANGARLSLRRACVCVCNSKGLAKLAVTAHTQSVFVRVRVCIGLTRGSLRIATVWLFSRSLGCRISVRPAFRTRRRLAYDDDASALLRRQSHPARCVSGYVGRRVRRLRRLQRLQRLQRACMAAELAGGANIRALAAGTGGQRARGGICAARTMTIVRRPRCTMWARRRCAVARLSPMACEVFNGPKIAV